MPPRDAVLPDPMLPALHRITGRWVETAESTTFTLAPDVRPLPPARPGQFDMLCVPGVGEIAVSVSGSAPAGVRGYTVRAVGPVSAALQSAAVGSPVGVRGPFGTGWELPADGARCDVLVVAGGVGLAPLRPLVLAARRRRSRYGRLMLVVGARDPAQFLYPGELGAWAGGGSIEVIRTVDVAAAGWDGPVGLVTDVLRDLPLQPERVLAFLCGPEPMMRFTAELLVTRGVPPERVRLSFERSMKCGVGLCGHCQLGPLIVCRDGPVVGYDVAAPLLAVRGL